MVKPEYFRFDDFNEERGLFLEIDRFVEFRFLSFQFYANLKIKERV
jgi:hypothetical protein